VECKFDYDTNAHDKPSKTVNILSVAEIMTQISKYGCLVFNKDIFHFEVCLGDEIKQSANDEYYTLGKYEKYTEGLKVQQLYTGGTLCDATRLPRKSNVEFTCRDDKPQVVSVDEYQTCQYKIVVGIPDVCGHPSFMEKFSEVETWVLELSETDEGEFICQVYNNGLDILDSNHFSEFKLEFTSKHLSLSSYGMRRANRAKVDEHNIKTQTTPPSLQATVDHSVQYAFIASK